ncbi:MAG: HAMP domain-containing sensor histidine kinase [Planctomycetota bacterium]
MRFTIRAQLMAPLALVAALSLLAVALAYSWLAARATTDRVEERLQGVVRVINQSSYPLTNSVLRQMAGLAGAEFLLLDGEGRRLADSKPDGAAVDPRLLPRATRSAIEVSLGQVIETPQGQLLHSAVRLDPRGGRREPQVLHVLFPKRDYNTAWRAAFLPPLAVGGLMIACAALVVNSISARIGRTLARLGESVQRLAEGKYSPPTAPRWNDETRDLVSSMNEAAQRMEKYEADLRRTERIRAVSVLGAGLAHEMRNAATGCRLAIDLHAEACHAGQQDDCLDVARRQLRSLEDRLQQLLQTGRQPEVESPELVDLTAIVREAIEVVRPAAQHLGIQIDRLSVAEERPVTAHREHLYQSIVNLLLNAVEAAGRDRCAGRQEAYVRVELDNLTERFELRVLDSGRGPELPSGDDCFEPFVSQKPEGVGIGLAIAKRGVEDAGGSIRWRRAGDATEFAIQLPIAATEQADA